MNKENSLDHESHSSDHAEWRNELLQETSETFGQLNERGGEDEGVWITVPFDVLASGFYVCRHQNDGRLIELWLHRTGTVPQVVLLNKKDAVRLARLVDQASDFPNLQGVISTQMGAGLLVSSRRHGATSIEVVSGGPCVHISRGFASMFAQDLRDMISSNSDDSDVASTGTSRKH